jgi:hypothetical protein
VIRGHEFPLVPKTLFASFTVIVPSRTEVWDQYLFALGLNLYIVNPISIRYCIDMSQANY